LRLTADGQLRSCLFSREETDLRPILRGELDHSAQASAIAAAIGGCVAGKLPGHGINDPSFIQPDRPMSAIGG
jgi:cyclic pyranopterin phosphate synthase